MDWKIESDKERLRVMKVRAEIVKEFMPHIQKLFEINPNIPEHKIDEFVESLPSNVQIIVHREILISLAKSFNERSNKVSRFGFVPHVQFSD